MKQKQLSNVLRAMLSSNIPVLIKGAPGIGKSDIVAQVCKDLDYDLIISHPVVSDPTDYKGLPFPTKEGTAEFLPFGELNKLLHAKKRTVFFLDDLGQASMSVQAACMQLLLARRINGHVVSDNVTFIAATNRRQDKAAVQGILEPVKSRFGSILELTVSLDDWVDWALSHDMPPDLIAYVKFKPQMLDSFAPSADITNSPCPRTVANVGKILNLYSNLGHSQDDLHELISGAAGVGFATEFMAFRKSIKSLPKIADIIAAPEKAQVFDEPSLLYAITYGLAFSATKDNIDAISKYISRCPVAYQMLLWKAAIKKNDDLVQTKAFTTFASEHQDAWK